MLIYLGRKKTEYYYYYWVQLQNWMVRHWAGTRQTGTGQAVKQASLEGLGGALRNAKEQ